MSRLRDILADALMPVAHRVYYERPETALATSWITDATAWAMCAHAWSVTREAPLRFSRTSRGRLDLLCEHMDGWSLAVEIDHAHKDWSAAKLARCAEGLWTEALWVRWSGRVEWGVPQSVCVLDMTRPTLRWLHTGAIAQTARVFNAGRAPTTARDRHRSPGPATASGR